MLRNINTSTCYIIAEIGGNFTTMDKAKRLIDAAADCGVDAIKLQTYRAKTITSRKAVFDMENTGKISQYDLFKKYEVGESLHREVFEYIKSKGLDWFSTPSHESDVEMLDNLGVRVHKIGSDDAVNFPFLKYVARTGKTILLSTGMCTMQEVRESVNMVLAAGNDRLVLLHAITSYPTHPEHVNLKAMQAMMREFPEIPVGYSDHTIGTTACICAAAMGAKVIEKHFTYDKTADGPDHMLSAEPSEMKTIVDAIRTFEKMKGNGIKRPADSEEITRINNRKSVIVQRDMKAGENIKPGDLAIKRPGFGIPPKYINQLIGRSLAKKMEVDSVLNWEDLQ